MNIAKPTRSSLILLLLFGILYALISFVNHYNFRTYTYDLGVYTNALYDYARFQWNDSLSFKLVAENLLADHFDLYLILFSPLSYLFGTYTLLVVQTLFILVGAYGCYAFVKERWANNTFAYGALLYYLSFFGSFTAVACGYHSSVVAASLVPWFFLSIHQKRFVSSSVLLLFMLIGKENMGLWLSFICLGLALIYKKDKQIIRFSIFASLFSGIYFYWVIKHAMPYFANNSTEYVLKYDFLGNSFSAATMQFFEHPIDTIKALFVSHLNDPAADSIKQNLHLTLLFSGLFVLFIKPQYLIMLIPIYLQKLYHNDYLKWGIGFHYAFEFAPILAIGVVSGIDKIKIDGMKRWSYIIVLALSIGTTVHVLDHKNTLMKRSQLRFYKADHYQRSYNVAKMHKALKMIPKESIVCAQPPFFPHLALRDHIYNYPFIQDAEYVVFSTLDEEEPYFSSYEEFVAFSDSLKQSENWEILFDDELTILKLK